MLRASAAAEEAGIPSSSLVCEGFLGQAATTSSGLGRPELPVALVPGHVDTQVYDDLVANVRSITVPAVVDNLTRLPDTVAIAADPAPGDIVFEGSFEDINRHFLDQRWSDGLPIVPPSKDKIDEFLAFCDLPADHSLGTLLPDNRAATVWSVAVNGVMAGCRPEYMPVLVAIATALTDPAYGVEHSGNTPGSETLITINGPIIGELEFNFEQGALRDGFPANTSIGRWFRLYIRNVAGFLPHETDKGTFGNTWRVVMAENEAVLDRIGWPTLAADLGIELCHNAITISRYTGGKVLTSVYGQTPEELISCLADGLVGQTGWELVFTIGIAGGTYRPLLLLTPILAETIAQAGWSKADLRQALFDQARIPASRFEQYLGEWTNLVPGRRKLVDFVNTKSAPKVFAESSDPDRLVPIVTDAEHILIGVTGDPMRTNAYVFGHNGMLGFPVAKEIVLPTGWDARS